MKYFILLTLLFGFNSSLMAKGKDIFWLDKDSVIVEAKKNAPTINRIESDLLTSQINKSAFLEGFQTSLEGNVSYFKTNEEPFIQFAPTVSPINKYSLGISKNFTTGMGIGIFNNYEKKKYEGYGVDAKNSVSVEFTMDLYKDFFGRDSRSRISYFDYEERVAQIQKDIDKEIFLVNLNRIYMSLIFNQEAINVSRDILEIYKNQQKDAWKRYTNGIADLSEVKRRQSQVASRRVDIFNLVNIKENLILDLKKLLPSIANKEVKLVRYSVKNIEKHFSKITADIRKKKETPIDYTQYDDIVRLMEKSYRSQKKFTKKHNDIDLELYSTYNHFGKDDDFSRSVENTHDNVAESSYEVGIRLVAPIGGAKRKSEKLLLARQRVSFLAKKRESLARIDAYHSQSIRNLELLRKAKVYQGQNSKNLKKILRLTEKKYRQARIPIRDLIEDQDLYLQSLLREIDLKLIIINQILDYMTVFTNTPFALS